MSIVMDERGALNSSFAPSEIRSTSNTPVLPNGPSTMTCKLCREPPVQPTYLNCKHVFCYMCLHAYVERNRYTDSLDFPCPHCSKLSAPPWGIWHLSHKILDRSHDELYQTWRYEAMCDNCALDALYATAGRHCAQCNINLCDTCSYAHSVMTDTQSHCITTLMSKDGGGHKAVIDKNQEIKTGNYSKSNQFISSR